MPTRVLHLIARMNVGGPALVVDALHRGLTGAFESRVLTGVVDGSEIDHLDLRGEKLDVTRLPELGRQVSAGRDARALAAVVRELRRFRPDILHTHTAKGGVLGRLAAELVPGTKRVHTFHGHLLHGYFSPSATRAVVLVERALARRTDAIVAVGARVRDELLAAGVGRLQQYRVMPPGVTIGQAPTRAEARRLLGLPPASAVIAFVARLTGVKRPERAVEVLRQLLPSHPGATLVVAGGGPLLAELRRQAEDLGERVRFLGWYAEVETVYAAADVVLLTSDNEGMPVSLIEASMLERPVVASDVGSVSEVVHHGETGLLGPPDVGSLARHVAELLLDGARRRRFGEAGRDRARHLFSEQRLVQETAELYRSLV